MKEHTNSKIKKLIKKFKKEAWKATPDPNALNKISREIMRVRVEANGGSGWKLESARHSLARKGIITGKRGRPRNYVGKITKGIKEIIPRR